MTELRFDVVGTPIAQGDLSAGKGGKLYHSNGRALERWRSAIEGDATSALRGGRRFEGPVRVDLWFRLERPKSHFLPANGRRTRPELRPGMPIFASGAPDVDKLARAALDALTGAAFGDDAQVARLGATKRFVRDAIEPPGLSVCIRPLEEWE